MPEITNTLIQQYCDAMTSAESPALAALNRDTHVNVLQPRMLSGHFQGRLLSLLSLLLRPQQILEIGTYTGYSAICLAEGLAPGGQLTTIDINPEQEERIHKHIEMAGMQDRIRFIVGDAYTIIRSLDTLWDMVFIDADKPNYSRYYDLVFDRVRPGGIIIADNVLWSGKVVDEEALAADKDTQLLHAFNQKVAADPRVDQILLPVRDGLMVVRKR